MLACDAVPKRRIVARAPKPVTIRATRPNLGIETEYKRRLDDLVAEMQKSLEYWLTAAYRANEPRIAQDATPAIQLQRAFNRLAKRWQRRIDDLAPRLARWFATATYRRTQAGMEKALKDAGWTVKFDPTPTKTDIFRATINENVSLIRSIASEHLSDVEQIVMRSVTQGRDMGALTKALQERFGITKRRAALISRDQSSKATAAINRAQQQELGITTAIWRHSSAGKHPRPEHVAANGKEYPVDKGMFLEGVWTWPGVEINCRCVSVSVLNRAGKQR